jgi:IS1 family transposase
LGSVLICRDTAQSFLRVVVICLYLLLSLTGVIVFGQIGKAAAFRVRENPEVAVSGLFESIPILDIKPNRKNQIAIEQFLRLFLRQWVADAYHDVRRVAIGIVGHPLPEFKLKCLVAEAGKGGGGRKRREQLSPDVDLAVQRGGLTSVNQRYRYLWIDSVFELHGLYGFRQRKVSSGSLHENLSALLGSESLNHGKNGDDEGSAYQHEVSDLIPTEIAMLALRGVFAGFCGIIIWGSGLFVILYSRSHRIERLGLALAASGLALMGAGMGVILLAQYQDWRRQQQSEEDDKGFHLTKIVTQKHLTSCDLCNTVISMANVLSTDKQIGVISALAEGSSIRSIERMTGVHRDTIMRLGVKVGQGCTALMDAKMRDLSCTRLEMDEIWGFVGKKDRNVRLNEPRPVGNVWTFCAIDAETKLVPAFKVGDRDIATAKAFVSDVASRMRNRVQISTDGLRAYVEAVESAFGSEVDFAQIVKTYGREEVSDNRRYSAPEFVSSEKKVITGNPEERLISTSYVERLNATTRLHMRRLTRLTLAFSKKRENFEAAVGLHFAYYNFVKRHNTLRCTPAMAAGVERDFCWRFG